MKLHIKNLILSLPVLIIILVISFSFAKVSYAAPAAPSPVCAIDATVLTVQKVKTNIAKPPREDFYYYAVKLKIQSSSVYQQADFGSCDNLINSDQDSILHLMEYDKAPIKVGQKINAKIRFGGDEWFNGYFLSDVKILATTTEPVVKPVVTEPVITKPTVPTVNKNIISTIKSSSEISAMLVEQKQLNSVDDIELSSDEQQYTARGHHDAKFLFFIPMSVKVELKVNAVNGNIEQVKKSWWVFLVR